MKEIRVNDQIVQLNNVSHNANLTPAIVRRALTVAYGNASQKAIVHDGNTGYKVTPRSIRRMTAEEEFQYIV